MMDVNNLSNQKKVYQCTKLGHIKKGPEKAAGKSSDISCKNLELKDEKEVRSIVNDLITTVEKQETKKLRVRDL